MNKNDNNKDENDPCTSFRLNVIDSSPHMPLYSYAIIRVIFLPDNNDNTINKKNENVNITLKVYVREDVRRAAPLFMVGLIISSAIIKTINPIKIF